MRAGNAGSSGTIPRWRLNKAEIATRSLKNYPQLLAFPAHIN